MACILVPMTEAVLTTIAEKAVKKHEASSNTASTDTISLSEKLGWLNKLLWGGSALLAFEHIWHGEISPVFPFLTAAADAASRAEMLHEMATSGVAMSILVTAVWGCMVAIVSHKHKRHAANCLPQKEVAQS